MKYIVRHGYAFRGKHQVFTGGTILDLTPEEVKGQDWKLEAVAEEGKPAEKDKGKKNKKDKDTPPLPPGFKTVTAPPVSKVVQGADATQKNAGEDEGEE